MPTNSNRVPDCVPDSPTNVQIQNLRNGGRMKFPNLKTVLGLFVIVGSVCLFSTNASATTVGLLRVDSGAGGVTVGLNSSTGSPRGEGPGHFLLEPVLRSQVLWGILWLEAQGRCSIFPAALYCLSPIS
jgi:hypothetical protein